jgi:hypothetical protein
MNGLGQLRGRKWWPGVAAGEQAKTLCWKLAHHSDPSDTNSPNSTGSPHTLGDFEEISPNSANENVVSSNSYHARGEFGEFHSPMAEFPEEKFSQPGMIEPSETTTQPFAVMKAPTNVTNDSSQEMPMEERSSMWCDDYVAR